MEEFVKSVCEIHLPSEFNKLSMISKLGSISKTNNLINDYEDIKHEYDLLKQNLNILKNQNELLIKENQNLNSNNEDYYQELETLRAKIKVNNIKFNIYLIYINRN
jgi:predicted nuclease with TOPRIM domain